MSRKQHTLLVCDEKEGERRKSKDAGEMAGIGESEIKIFIAADRRIVRPYTNSNFILGSLRMSMQRL